MREQAVYVGVCRLLDIHIATANVVQSHITVTSVQASNECARKTVLYGSTISVAICGKAHRVRSSTAQACSTSHVFELGEDLCDATGI